MRDSPSPSAALSLSQQQLSCVRLPPHRSSLPRARLPPHQQRIIISLSHLRDRTPSKSPRPKLHRLEQPRLHKSGQAFFLHFFSIALCEYSNSLLLLVVVDDDIQEWVWLRFRLCVGVVLLL
eukprot:TRINITY_DN5698_c1_g2_i1.p2 TRINITY_DN5698_c1_g2~~TRINITY_DN5698_c1_g2_i1.p2  ORF type:complete len:122 (+),score=25.03 TRINITY_DN5698_c1_g2_i1:1075-1440(+)